MEFILRGNFFLFLIIIFVDAENLDRVRNLIWKFIRCNNFKRNFCYYYIHIYIYLDIGVYALIRE